MWRRDFFSPATECGVEKGFACPSSHRRSDATLMWALVMFHPCTAASCVSGKNIASSDQRPPTRIGVWAVKRNVFFRAREKA